MPEAQRSPKNVTATEAGRLTGVHYSSVKRWESEGLLAPEAGYSYRDLLVLSVLRELRQGVGLEVAVLLDAIRVVKAADLTALGPNDRLVVRGTDVAVLRGDDVLQAVQAKCGDGRRNSVVLVDLPSVVDDLAAKLGGSDQEELPLAG